MSTRCCAAARSRSIVLSSMRWHAVRITWMGVSSGAVMKAARSPAASFWVIASGSTQTAAAMAAAVDAKWTSSAGLFGRGQCCSQAHTHSPASSCGLMVLCSRSAASKSASTPSTSSSDARVCSDARLAAQDRPAGHGPQIGAIVRGTPPRILDAGVNLDLERAVKDGRVWHCARANLAAQRGDDVHVVIDERTRFNGAGGGSGR